MIIMSGRLVKTNNTLENKWIAFCWSDAVDVEGSGRHELPVKEVRAELV